MAATGCALIICLVSLVGCGRRNSPEGPCQVVSDPCSGALASVNIGQEDYPACKWQDKIKITAEYDEKNIIDEDGYYIFKADTKTSIVTKGVYSSITNDLIDAFFKSIIGDRNTTAMISLSVKNDNIDHVEKNKIVIAKSSGYPKEGFDENILYVNRQLTNPMTVKDFESITFKVRAGHRTNYDSAIAGNILKIARHVPNNWLANLYGSDSDIKDANDEVNKFLSSESFQKVEFTVSDKKMLRYIKKMIVILHDESLTNVNAKEIGRIEITKEITPSVFAQCINSDGKRIDYKRCIENQLDYNIEPSKTESLSFKDKLHQGADFNDSFPERCKSIKKNIRGKLSNTDAAAVLWAVLRSTPRPASQDANTCPSDNDIETFKALGLAWENDVEAYEDVKFTVNEFILAVERDKSIYLYLDDQLIKDGRINDDFRIQNDESTNDSKLFSIKTIKCDFIFIKNTTTIDSQKLTAVVQFEINKKIYNMRLFFSSIDKNGKNPGVRSIEKIQISPADSL